MNNSEIYLKLQLLGSYGVITEDAFNAYTTLTRKEFKEIEEFFSKKIIIKHVIIEAEECKQLIEDKYGNM